MSVQEETDPAPRVFISFSRQDGDDHTENVRRLYELLRRNHVDAHWDGEMARPKDWALRMTQDAEDSGYILLIASPMYKHYADRDRPDKGGRGVVWEARWIRHKLYGEGASEFLRRVLLVVLPGRSASELPGWSYGQMLGHYEVPEITTRGIERILRHVFNRPYGLPELGSMPDLPTQAEEVARREADRIRSRGLQQDIAEDLGRALGSFRGRAAALSRIKAWLLDIGDYRSLFVTGGPGSGKTALLGFVAHLASGYGYRVSESPVPEALLPPINSIDVAVYVRNMVPADIVARLAAVAGMPDAAKAVVGAANLAEACSALVSHLRARGMRLTVLLDALDEVSLSNEDEPDTSASGLTELGGALLAPLVSDSDAPIRFLLGGRAQALAPAGFGPIAQDERIMDLDGAYQDNGALRDRARMVLLGQDPPDEPGDHVLSPWQRAPTADVETVLDEIAAIAGKSFYIAEAIARGQAQLKELPDLTGTEWKAALPKDAGPAMRAELDERLGTSEQAQRALRLLLPLAYGRGDGIPWDNVWLPLANALRPAGSAPFSNADLEWIWNHASSYVVRSTSSQTGRSVFRLYHQTLGTYLRSSEWPGQGSRSQSDDERVIVACLLGRVPVADGRRDWTAAPAYVRAHLLEHAVAGGSLADIDGLVLDPGFLANGPDSELRAALSRLTEPRHRAVADAHGAVLAALLATPVTESSHAAGGAKSTGEVRAFLSQLSLAARCRGVEALADRIEVGDGPTRAAWEARWASWRQQPPYVRLPGHTNRVRALTTAILPDRRTVTVTGDDDGEIRVWDLIRGALIHVIRRAHTGSVLALAAGSLPDGKTIAVSTGRDHCARVWNLSTAQPLGEPFTGHNSPVQAVTMADLPGRGATAVTGDGSGVIRFWNPANGREIRPAYATDADAVTALAMTRLQDKPHIVSAHSNGIVLASSLASTVARVSARWPGSRTVRALAVAHERQPVLVFAGDDGVIHKWDPVHDLAPTGTAKEHVIAEHSRGVWTLSVAGLSDGTPVIVSGGADKAVRVWGLTDGHPMGGPFTGHTAQVRALNVMHAGGRSMVVSAGDDKVPMVWDLTASGTVNEPFAGHQRRVRSLLFTEIDGRARLVSAGSDATIRQWDPETGAQVGSPIQGQLPVGALARVSIGGRECIAFGAGKQVLVRVAASGEEVTAAVKLPGEVTALTTVPVGGTRRLVAACRNGTVHVWDPETDEQPIRYEGGDRAGAPVWALGSGYADPSRSDPLIVSAGEGGGLHLWDPSDPVTTAPAAMASGHRTVTAIAAIHSRPSWVATGGDDGVIRVHDLSTPASQPGEWGRHENSPVHALAVVSEGDSIVIVSAHADGTVQFSDGSARRGASIEHAHGGHARALAAGIAGSRRVVFSGGDDYKIKVWSVERRAELQTLHGGWVRAVAACPYPASGPQAGKWMIVSAGDDDIIQVRDLDGGQAGREHVIPARHREVRALAVAATDPPLVVSGGVDHRLQIWDPATKSRRGSLPGHGDWIRALATASLPDVGPVAVSASGDGHVGIWDIARQAAIGAPRDLRSGGVRAVAVSEASSGKGPTLISGAGNAILVSALVTGERIGDPFTQHQAPVRALVAVALGDRTAVISGDEESIVLAWDLETREPILGRLPHPQGEINALAAHQRGYGGDGCTWVAVAAGEAVTLSSWSRGVGWEERMTAHFGCQVLALAMPQESWDDEPPGRLAVGATQGVVVLLVGGRPAT